MKRGCLLFGLLLASHNLSAQSTAGPATITFLFDNPALQPARFSLLIHEDGTGRYHSEPGSAPMENASAPQPLDRDITLADPLRKQLFALARKNHLFATQCSSKQSNIAFTGNKTLTYTGPEGAGSCTFNYAHDSQIEQVADNLIAVAATLDEGRKLELLLSHDKLGLNAEVELLTSEQATGRALDLQNIAPVLHAIADNEEVLRHTRTRAEALLAH